MTKCKKVISKMREVEVIAIDRPAADLAPRRKSLSGSHYRLVVLGCQVLLLAMLLTAWHFLTEYEILPSFIFGEPLAVAEQIWKWLPKERYGFTFGPRLLKRCWRSSSAHCWV
ncbi:MAG: hypothetical protein WDN48_20140 [Pseudolabrys sp.]